MSNPNPENPAAPIAAVIKDVTQTPGDFPLEVSIPDSPQKFTAKTPQEMLDKLVAAQTEATRTIASERSQRAALEGQVNELKSRIPAPPDAAAADAELQEQFNRWAKNPTEATRHDLAKLLGVAPDRVVDVMKEAIGNSVVNKAADEFLVRCPDFPQTPQTAALIKNALAARYGSTMEAATADNLEIVYHQLVREGQIQPQSPPPTGLINANIPIPNLRGPSAPPNPVNDIMRQAYTMPLEQLKEVIDRLSAAQGR